MAGKAGTRRRSKKEIIVAQMAAIDDKITELEKKIDALKASKEELNTSLTALKEEEDKAAEEKKLKEVVALIKKSGMSMDEVKERLTAKTTDTEE